MTFTLYGPVIQKITSLFKHTKMNITVCSSNTIYSHIKPKIPSTIDNYTVGFMNLYVLHANFSVLDKVVSFKQ